MSSFPLFSPLRSRCISVQEYYSPARLDSRVGTGRHHGHVCTGPSKAGNIRPANYVRKTLKCQEGLNLPTRHLLLLDIAPPLPSCFSASLRGAPCYFLCASSSWHVISTLDRAQSLVDELLTVYTQEVYRLCKRAGVAMPSLVGQQDRVATGRSRLAMSSCFVHFVSRRTRFVVVAVAMVVVVFCLAILPY